MVFLLAAMDTEGADQGVVDAGEHAAVRQAIQSAIGKLVGYVLNGRF
jgi:hypothetical protein